MIIDKTMPETSHSKRGVANVHWEVHLIKTGVLSKYGEKIFRKFSFMITIWLYIIILPIAGQKRRKK